MQQKSFYYLKITTIYISLLLHIDLIS